MQAPVLQPVNISTVIRTFTNSMLSLLEKIEAKQELKLHFEILKGALHEINGLNPSSPAKIYLHDFLNIVKIVEPPVGDLADIQQWKTLYDTAVYYANHENKKLSDQKTPPEIKFLDICQLFNRKILTFPKKLITWGDKILNENGRPRLIEDIDGNLTHTFIKFAQLNISSVYIEAVNQADIPILPKSISRKLSRINAGDCFLVEIKFNLEDTELNNINLAKALACFNSNNTGCYAFEEKGADKKIYFYIKSTESNRSLQVVFGESIYKRQHQRQLEIKKCNFLDRELVLITQLDPEPNHTHNYDAGMVYFSKDNKQILIANGKVDVHMRCALNIGGYLEGSAEDAVELASPIWKQSGVRYRAYHNGKYGIPGVRNRNEIKTILMAIGVSSKNIDFIAA